MKTQRRYFETTELSGCTHRVIVFNGERGTSYFPKYHSAYNSGIGMLNCWQLSEMKQIHAKRITAARARTLLGKHWPELFRKQRTHKQHTT